MELARGCVREAGDAVLAGEAGPGALGAAAGDMELTPRGVSLPPRDSPKDDMAQPRLLLRPTVHPLAVAPCCRSLLAVPAHGAIGNARLSVVNW